MDGAEANDRLSISFQKPVLVGSSSTTSFYFPAAIQRLSAKGDTRGPLIVPISNSKDTVKSCTANCSTLMVSSDGARRSKLEHRGQRSAACSYCSYSSWETADVRAGGPKLHRCPLPRLSVGMLHPGHRGRAHSGIGKAACGCAQQLYFGRRISAADSRS